MERIVVVGAGLAGLRACEGLRARDYAGALTLVGDELHWPYDRPPLSKQYLAGEWALERVTLRPVEEYGELSIEARRGAEHRAVELDAAGRTITLASGERLAFDGAVIATGARARSIPAFDVLGDRVHLLRTLDDSVRLRQVLPGARVLLVGAGFIGMEVAATARSLGATVVVVEPLDAPLSRVLGPLAGSACARLHLEHGVELLLGRSVDGVRLNEDGSVTGVLSDGSTVEADQVVVGIGAAPNTEWLAGSGLERDPAGGILCDAALVAAPGVVVAGDVASVPAITVDAGAAVDAGAVGGAETRVRLEHRTNAAEQGDHAAASLLGGTEPFRTVPYVWSDQYDVKIQVLGLPAPTDECVVVDGGVEEGRFLAVYGRGGRLTAAVGFSKPRSLMRLRPLLAAGSSFDQARHAFD